MKKPLFLVFNDIHIQENNIELTKDIFQQAIEVAKEKDITNLILLGDVFVSRKSQRQDVLNAFGGMLDTIPIGFRLYCVPGNHDKAVYESECSFLDPFKSHPHLDLISCPDEVDFIEGVRAHFLPFFSEKVYLSKMKFNLLKEGKNILLTHTAFSGSINNDGSKQEINIKPSLFKDFDLVLSGHYHDQQKIGNNIYHLPSTHQSNFGEDDQKGFTILYDDLSMELVLSKFKKYENIKIDLDKTPKKKFDELVKQYSNSENNVRFTITGSEDKVKSINQTSLNVVGIDVKKNNKEVETVDVEQSLNVKKYNKESLKEEFVVFCEERNYEYEQGIKYLK